MRDFAPGMAEPHRFDPIDRLRGMYRNTELDQAMEYADNVQQLLNTTRMQPALASNLLEQLNQAWPYMDQPIEISGTVFYQPANTPDFTSRTLIDTPLKSEGFSVQQVNRTIDGRRQLINEVMLQFEGGVVMQRWNLDSTMVPATIDIATHRLWYFHADEAARIQDMLQGNETEPQPSPIMKLRRYCIDMLVADIFYETYKRDLEAYLTNVMAFDSLVPYQLLHHASPIQPELDEPEVWRAVVAPKSIELQPVDVSKTPCPHYPHLVASLYNRDPQVPNHDISIPLSSITALRSYRLDGDI